MYPIPSNETLVETKVCKHCNVSFPITNKDLEFYEKVSPVFNGQKYQIPTPTLCPDCRQQRRLVWRNDRKLYKRKCDATGRDIISIYSPDKPFKVYHQDEWWSDHWDPMDYGKDFDFGRGFFEQFDALIKEVPIISAQNKNSLNCDYSNGCIGSKDCYLSNTTHNSEDIHYSSWILRSNNCIDCLRSTDINNSYNAVNCHSSDNLFCCTMVNDSGRCGFCYDLRGCNDCFLCYNLTNKKYCIENIEYSKDEYYKRIEQLQKYDSNKINTFFEKIIHLIKTKAIHKSDNNSHSEECKGDYLHNCKNCIECYDLIGAENCKYFWEAGGPNEYNCFDCSYGGYGPEYCYEALSAAGYKNRFTIYGIASKEIFYSISSFDSSHLFGCIGLRNKSYCILNKQYTKEEYEALVPKIIKHMRKTSEWGEFFPSSLSPFGYNETVAQEYFPLNKEEATKNGVFNWSDYEAPFPRVEKIIPAAKLPEDISKIPDDILNWAIECEVTGKPFRIIKQELEFYRKHNLPIPRRHPDQRHLDRMSLRNPRKLFKRKCDKCGVEMMTTYSPERSEVVYCEECYNKEVIG